MFDQVIKSLDKPILSFKNIREWRYNHKQKQIDKKIEKKKQNKKKIKETPTPTGNSCLLLNTILLSHYYLERYHQNITFFSLHFLLICVVFLLGSAFVIVPLDRF